MSARRPPPQLLERLSAADRAADRWLAARGEPAWRWPRREGRAVGVKEGAADRDAAALAELADALAQARVRGLDLNVLDAPMVTSTAAAAASAHRSMRSVQLSMKKQVLAEAAGQLALPGLLAAAAVYKTRAASGSKDGQMLKHNNGSNGEDHGC